MWLSYRCFTARTATFMNGAHNGTGSLTVPIFATPGRSKFSPLSPTIQAPATAPSVRLAPIVAFDHAQNR